MKNKIIIIFLIGVLSIVGYSQELPQVVPLSPEASSIFKFNETPVSLYSGTQNTTIPLLEINAGGLSIPISLSYFSRGVQVSEVASRVGIGWTLNYGGMISRQIRGIADEKAFQNFNNNSTPIYYSDSNARENELIYNEGNYCDFCDYYPDKFMINSNFYSGEFYFDKNNPELITQKYSDIKIFTDGFNPAFGFEKFKVKDNFGNVYLFGGLSNNLLSNEHETIINAFRVPSGDSSVYFDSNPNSNPSFSTFNLRKIETPTKETIEYIYEDENVFIVRRTGDVENSYHPVTDNNDVMIDNSTVTCNFNTALSYQKVLKEIIYEGGKVKFIKSTEGRQDLAGGFALDRIEQYNIKDSLVKVIKFNYHYKTGFEDSTNVNQYLVTADNKATKRLFLSSIDFVDKETNVEQSYSFEYEEQMLPNRHSNSIDFWGYYNGKNRGHFLRFEDVAGNCAVDPVKIQAGILKKITYPTGGSSVFEYEPNILQNALPDMIKIPNPNQSFHQNIVLSIIDTQNYNPATGRYEKTFTVSNAIGNKARTAVSISNTDTFICQLKNNSTNHVALLNEGVNPDFMLQNGVSYTLIVDPRDAYWNPNPNSNSTNLMDNNFLVSISYLYSEYNYNEIIFGPGNRIKKITNYTADDIEEFSRIYEYKNDNNYPSGILLSVSNFKTHHPAYPPNSTNNITSNVFDWSPNIPGGMFNSFMKDNFGYGQVNEYFVDNTNNSNEKTAHFYSIIPDFGSYFKFPLHPITDNEWLRGKELQTVLFKKENNLFKPLKKIENVYLLYGTRPIFYPTFPFSIEEGYMPTGMQVEYEKPKCENFTAFPYLRNRTSFVYPVSTGCPYYSSFPTICGSSIFQQNAFSNTIYYTPGYRTTSFIGGTFDLHTTKVTEYFENGQEMETLTTYDYDYANHYNLAKTTSTNSTGETIETKYFYPQDPEMVTKPFVNSLIDKNIVGIPLVTESFKNGEKLSTQETVYKDWGNNLLAPEIIKTAKGNQSLENRIKYNVMDNTNGNPLEIEQVGGIKIVYIWGYNKTQPIAKIENATYASIPSSTITNLQNLSNTGTEANLIAALNALRVSLPNAMITTYTYKPLIGISTVTDPKGDKQTYHYDSFNRLQFVKDAQGNILSENEYHYKQ